MLVHTAFWVCAHEGFHVFTTLQVCQVVVVVIEGKISPASEEPKEKRTHVQLEKLKLPLIRSKGKLKSLNLFVSPSAFDSGTHVKSFSPLLHAWCHTHMDREGDVLLGHENRRRKSTARFLFCSSYIPALSNLNVGFKIRGFFACF